MVSTFIQEHQLAESPVGINESKKMLHLIRYTYSILLLNMG